MEGDTLNIDIKRWECFNGELDISIEGEGGKVVQTVTSEEAVSLVHELLGEIVLHKVDYWLMVDKLVELGFMEEDQILYWVEDNLSKMTDPEGVAFKLLKGTVLCNTSDNDLIDRLIKEGILTEDMIEYQADKQRKWKS